MGATLIIYNEPGAIPFILIICGATLIIYNEPGLYLNIGYIWDSMHYISQGEYLYIGYIWDSIQCISQGGEREGVAECFGSLCHRLALFLNRLLFGMLSNRR